MYCDSELKIHGHFLISLFSFYLSVAILAVLAVSHLHIWRAGLFIYILKIVRSRLLLFKRNQAFYCFLDCTHQIRFKSRGVAIVGLEIS